MSKKLACGADAIVIDIKVGEGAFMKTEEDAKNLAKIIIEIGAKMDRKVIAVISAMHEPLGFAVGNALEVKEAIDTLKGNGPADLTELCLELGSNMLMLAQVVSSKEEGVSKLKELIASGAAFEKFKEFVKTQGGDIKEIEDTNLLPSTQFSYTYKSKTAGFITHLNALDIGLASVSLGAGRETKASTIDMGAGILLKKKIGDKVKEGDPLAILYANDESFFIKAEKFLNSAYEINPQEPLIKPLILNTCLLYTSPSPRD